MVQALAAAIPATLSAMGSTAASGIGAVGSGLASGASAIGSGLASGAGAIGGGLSSLGSGASSLLLGSAPQVVGQTAGLTTGGHVLPVLSSGTKGLLGTLGITGGGGAGLGAASLAKAGAGAQLGILGINALSQLGAASRMRPDMGLRMPQPLSPPPVSLGPLTPTMAPQDPTAFNLARQRQVEMLLAALAAQRRFM